MTFPTCFWRLEGQDGPKRGLLRLHRGAILRPESGRIGFRIGLAGLEFPNRANADVAELPLSFHELFCTRFWWFEGRDGPKRGPPRLQQGAISRPESGRIGCRTGLAGLEFLSRSHADGSNAPFGCQELLPTRFWPPKGAPGPRATKGGGGFKKSPESGSSFICRYGIGAPSSLTITQKHATNLFLCSTPLPTSPASATTLAYASPQRGP